MAEKTNKTSAPVPEDLPFEGMTVRTTTFLGLKYSGALPKNDAEKEKVVEALRKQFTLTVDFNYTGFTKKEAVAMLSSTTSAMKMLQNNELKHWTKEQALENCKEVYICMVRDMVDNKQTRAISDEEKMRRSINKMIEKGKTKEEILEMIESL
jgi:predicted HAD superfamily phosphohydrolase